MVTAARVCRQQWGKCKSPGGGWCEKLCGGGQQGGGGWGRRRWLKLVFTAGVDVRLWSCGGGELVQSWLLRGAAGALLGELESNLLKNKFNSFARYSFPSAVPPPLLWKQVISLIPLHTSMVLLFSSFNSSFLL